jgi:hypothetical protein
MRMTKRITRKKKNWTRMETPSQRRNQSQSRLRRISATELPLKETK